MNIKIFGLKDQVNFASASEDGKIVIFIPQVSTHARAKFLPRSREFYNNGDKLGWIKYWLMTFNLPNSPKFSLATILRYTAYKYIHNSPAIRQLYLLGGIILT